MRSQKNRRKEKLMSCVTWHLLMLGRDEAWLQCLCVFVYMWKRDEGCGPCWHDVCQHHSVAADQNPTHATLQQVQVTIQRCEWKSCLWCHVISMIRALHVRHLSLEHLVVWLCVSACFVFVLSATLASYYYFFFFWPFSQRSYFIMHVLLLKVDQFTL